MNSPQKKPTLLFNIVFVVVSITIVFFLLKAPAVSTPKLPHDDDHSQFFSMKKKAASAHCVECHAMEEIDTIHKKITLNTSRCLFCHRRD